MFDLRKGKRGDVSLLKPVIVIASDIPFEQRGPNQMTVKSCASHIATNLVKQFGIPPNRMMWVEYYPGPVQGENLRYTPQEHFDEGEFTWKDGEAFTPRWKPLNPAVEKLVRELLADSPEK
jgi:hypothetical protein